jgi:hypothetical protein
MGQITRPPKALLFFGILHSPSVEFETLRMRLEKTFGAVILKSDSFPFLETEYYCCEMGEELVRIWIGFDNLIEPDQLVDIKHTCNSIEQEGYSISGKRKVNLDPGYITLGKVVLASTKNNQHRIYLGRGIFGEVTLRYRRKSFEPWEWTYADYRRKEAIQFFIQLRIILKKYLHETGDVQ